MAGFEPLESWKWDKVVVASHPDLDGYLIKAFLDDHFLCDEVSNFLLRIRGAENIRNMIHAFGYGRLLKVPQKWIYPLPDYPEAHSGLKRKNFILVVERLDIVNESKNESLYQEIDKKQLLAFFHVVSTVGLADSVYIKNAPFTKDYRIAFVDTERNQIWPINYKKIGEKLSPKMKAFWDLLTFGKQ